MKRHSIRQRSIICLAILIMLVSASCSVAIIAEATPTVVPTSTPERLKLIGGEIDPCLLVTLEEVETVLGAKVTGETKLLDYMPSCKYISTTSDQAVLLIISAVTDVSIEKADQPWLKEGNVPISAAKVYESERMVVSKRSEIYKFKDLDNLGDQAFLYETNLLVINVLRNDILYRFNGRTDHGVDYDALIKLIKIALERMP
jgi:hypothetical protein